MIYAESRFRDQESHAGALGLMQITPQTADVIAHLSGGTQFVTGDLSNPEINIRYGSYYLRYLLDRYDGNEVAALAAYNAGSRQRRRLGRRGRSTWTGSGSRRRAPMSRRCSKSARSTGTSTPDDLGMPVTQIVAG